MGTPDAAHFLAFGSIRHMRSYHRSTIRAVARVTGLLLLFGLALSCSTNEPEATEDPWPAIPPFYQRFNNSIRTEDEVTAWKSLPIETISLKSSGCYGQCPQYELQLMRGGQAVVHGFRFVGRLEGKHRTKITLAKFAQLCLFLDRFRFLDLDPRYSAGGMHDNTVTLSVTYTGQEDPVVVSDYGRHSPPEFLLLVIAIEFLLHDLDWEPA